MNKLNILEKINKNVQIMSKSLIHALNNNINSIENIFKERKTLPHNHKFFSLL
jgi:hypothetical protein